MLGVAGEIEYKKSVEYKKLATMPKSIFLGELKFREEEKLAEIVIIATYERGRRSDNFTIVIRCKETKLKDFRVEARVDYDAIEGGWNALKLPDGKLVGGKLLPNKLSMSIEFIVSSISVEGSYEETYEKIVQEIVDVVVSIANLLSQHFVTAIPYR